MESIYEKNIQAVSQIDPALAAKLFSVSENRRFEVYTSNDPINVNIYDTYKEFIFYPNNPVDDITKQYEEMMKKYIRYPYMWIYGISNGLLVKMLLNLEKTLYVIEPNLELLYIALNLLDFSKEIEEKRLNIYLSSDVDINTTMKICYNKDIKVFLKLYGLEINNEFYMKFHPEDIKRVNKLFVDSIKDIVTKEGNDAKDSLIGLDHHLKHLPKMIASYPLQNLKKKVNTPHAVIVSTGPSLAKQLPLLKEYQEYVTILCIDASLPILQREGIRPDFVFSMERVEPTAKFYENLDRELLKDTIFMPTSIVHPKTLENIGDMRLAISARPFGYTYMFKLKKWGYIGVGMSAANMAFDFAFISKFKNIVLIGQDLAFAPDGKTHSKGAIYGEEEEQYAKNTLEIKGYYGDKVKTSSVWHLFLMTFIRDVPRVKEEGINVFNCTEGGAYIDGAEHIPFREFLDKIEKAKKEKIECKTISKDRQIHILRRRKVLIEIYIKRLENVKSQVEKTFLELMKNIEELEKLNKDKELEKIDFDKLAEVINKIDKIKDLYEEDRAMVKFGNITNTYILNAELELAKIMVRNSETEIEKKSKMIDWIYAHKNWLFFLAGAIDNIIYVFKKNYEEVYADIG